MAYDPARDMFKEIPEKIPEEAITEHDNAASSSVDFTRSSSPGKEVHSDEHGRKRRRSGSMERPQDADERENHRQDLNQSRKKNRRSTERSPGRDKSNESRNHEKSTAHPPRTVSDLPRVPRRQREDGEVSTSQGAPAAYSRRPEMDQRHYRNGAERRRSRSPRDRNHSSVYRRRSPPRERHRSPSPIRKSPPREPIIRPGGARGRGRNVLAEQQRLAAEREKQNSAFSTQSSRGVQDVSNQFYNARPEWVKERGRDWRKNESQIKGLRSFNNWIKSCMIQRFSAEEKSVGEEEELGWGEEAKEPEEKKPLLVLDVGCGKGGDLGKWQLAPQQVGLYVGLDPADTSIRQAHDRYIQMRRGRRPIFDARFVTKDCFGEWIGDIGIVREVGIDSNVGTGTISRFGGGGFDIVTMMFSMHYSFESEEKVQMMLRNVAGSLKKGGRFMGVVPSSEVLSEHVKDWFAQKQSKQANGQADGEQPEANGTPKDDETPNWGNSIYRVRFSNDPSRPLNPDGSFRPPFSWKYTYWMAEAVDVPEFVVPWEAFRAIAEGFNLEQRYRKPFLDIWETERHDREMSQLAARMGVTRHDSSTGEDVLTISPEEREAVSFYHAFCFVKV